MAYEKLDLRSRPPKAAVIADLKKQLKDATAKLEQKMAVKDEKSVKKLQEIIQALNETIARQQ
ncbi:MAG: hypothetical protein IJX89_02235 [Alphaproteobacteria bacterium]|nr:hypothetical protein [Alphaproteobacteria bacterium]